MVQDEQFMDEEEVPTPNPFSDAGALGESERVVAWEDENNQEDVVYREFTFEEMWPQ